MSAGQWLHRIRDAIGEAVDRAEAEGLDLPGADELAELKAKANEVAAELLPYEAALIAAAVNVVAARAEANIARLGTVARCPACNGVLTIHAEVSPVGGDSSQTTSCSSCGWKSA